MDKILSARLDESTVCRIGLLSQRLHTSKKKIIEDAIQLYSRQVEEKQEMDIFTQTFGAWKRKKKGALEIENIRAAFRRSMMRHQK